MELEPNWNVILVVIVPLSSDPIEMRFVFYLLLHVVVLFFGLGVLDGCIVNFLDG